MQTSLTNLTTHRHVEGTSEDTKIQTSGDLSMCMRGREIIYWFRHKELSIISCSLTCNARTKLNPSFEYLMAVYSRFGLFEAMSAIEMMDPKMDAGMIFKKDKNILSFKEAVEVLNQWKFEVHIARLANIKLHVVSASLIQMSYWWQ